MTDERRQPDEDWEAVSAAISARLGELRMTQMDVASRAQVSLTTLRELQHNINARRRRPQTLGAISTALGWPPGYLDQVLRDADPEPHRDEADDQVLSAIAGLKENIRVLRTRVEAVERQLAREAEQP